VAWSGGSDRSESESPALGGSWAVGWAEKSSIQSIRFEYPADTGFVLNKMDGRWMLDDQLADSAFVESFLNTISSRTLNDFADHVSPQREADFRLTIYGNSMDNLVISCYLISDSEECYLHSSLNPKVYFKTSMTALPDQLFPGKIKFLPDNK
jgi:hypothetical protein